MTDAPWINPQDLGRRLILIVIRPARRYTVALIVKLGERNGTKSLTVTVSPSSLRESSATGRHQKPTNLSGYGVFQGMTYFNISSQTRRQLRTRPSFTHVVSVPRQKLMLSDLLKFQKSKTKLDRAHPTHTPIQISSFLETHTDMDRTLNHNNQQLLAMYTDRHMVYYSKILALV